MVGVEGRGVSSGDGCLLEAEDHDEFAEEEVEVEDEEER